MLNWFGSGLFLTCRYNDVTRINGRVVCQGGVGMQAVCRYLAPFPANNADEMMDVTNELRQERQSATKGGGTNKQQTSNRKGQKLAAPDPNAIQTRAACSL